MLQAYYMPQTLMQAPSRTRTQHSDHLHKCTEVDGAGVCIITASLEPGRHQAADA